MKEKKGLEFICGNLCNLWLKKYSPQIAQITTDRFNL
jgi:hypothetical protein